MVLVVAMEGLRKWRGCSDTESEWVCTCFCMCLDAVVYRQLYVLNHSRTKDCVLCVFWGSQQSGRNICTQWHRPSAFTHGSCRATLHGLASCDLPEAPGELFLLKASCVSYFQPAKYCIVQLFTWEASCTTTSLSPFHIFWELLCRFKRAWYRTPVIALLLPKELSWPLTLCWKLTPYIKIIILSVCTFNKVHNSDFFLLFLAMHELDVIFKSLRRCF